MQTCGSLQFGSLAVACPTPLSCLVGRAAPQTTPWPKHPSCLSSEFSLGPAWLVLWGDLTIILGPHERIWGSSKHRTWNRMVHTWADRSLPGCGEPVALFSSLYSVIRCLSCSPRKRSSKGQSRVCALQMTKVSLYVHRFSYCRGKLTFASMGWFNVRGCHHRPVLASGLLESLTQWKGHMRMWQSKRSEFRSLRELLSVTASRQLTNENLNI